jgi:hypothetical protein
MSLPRASYLTPLNPTFLDQYSVCPHLQVSSRNFQLLFSVASFKMYLDLAISLAPFSTQLVGAMIVWPQLFLDVADFYAREIVRVIRLHKLYGPSGIPLLLFGSRAIWRIQAQILGQVKDDDALEFKKSVYNECTMIAVAVRTFREVDISPTNGW